MGVEEDPMSWLSYDRERVDELHRRARVAVDELAGIRSDDLLAADALRAVRLAQSHLEADWLPLLDRVRASTSLTAPIDFDAEEGRSWFEEALDAVAGPADGRTVIAPIVAELSDEEREFFQGFVEECAASVAAELSLYDAHPDYRVDRLPDELYRLDERSEWLWLAQLYLIEQFHHMISTGAVELQRNGEHYWIDPIDLTDTNDVIAGELILAAVASGGRFGRGTGGAGMSAAGAKTATRRMPRPHNLLRGKAAADAAAALGYTRRVPPQKLPFDSRGQPGFFNGKTYITPDRDAHRGGVWKMYKGRTRLGTFDAQLNRID
jgi:hypothetical protein